MSLKNNAILYAHNHQQNFLADLVDLIAIPSISTSHEHKADMIRAAEWLKGHLKQIGMENVNVFPTPGHPIVYAEKLLGATDKPTVLIYGHYDVQPPEPMELWNNPPFTAAQNGDLLFGRGSSDMKGQIMASLAAIESVLKQGDLPLNIKIILEGEEEIGSTHFPEFLRIHADMLKCDVVFNPDAGMISPEMPTIVYALRGLSYFELTITGPTHDLHSGMFGGVVHNPANVLAKLIADMHDQEGRITLPGFFDSVIDISDEERAELSRLPMNKEYFLAQTGAPDLRGETGYSEIERIGARPSLDVNGMISGFTGPGSKTIIPSWAMAKISMRLVPDQDPKEVYKQFNQFLVERAPSTVSWELKMLGGGAASIADLKHPAVSAYKNALEEIWGTKPVFKREGGSVPITRDFKEILGADSVLCGFGLPGDLIHSPNEHLHLPTWKKGIDAIIVFLYEFSSIG